MKLDEVEWSVKLHADTKFTNDLMIIALNRRNIKRIRCLRPPNSLHINIKTKETQCEDQQ